MHGRQAALAQPESKRRAVSPMPPSTPQIKNKAAKRNPNLPKIVYLAVEIKQKKA
jgi:hypothetical protein